MIKRGRFKINVNTPTGNFPLNIYDITTAIPDIPPGAIPIGSKNILIPSPATSAPVNINTALVKVLSMMPIFYTNAIIFIPYI